jgi:hypothetical protein
LATTNLVSRENFECAYGYLERKPMVLSRSRVWTIY